LHRSEPLHRPESGPCRPLRRPGGVALEQLSRNCRTRTSSAVSRRRLHARDVRRRRFRGEGVPRTRGRGSHVSGPGPGPWPVGSGPVERIVVACLGDSITAGSPLWDPDPAERGRRLGLAVALADVLPWNNGDGRAANDIARLNALVRALAEGLGVPLLPFHDTLVDPARPHRMREEWTDDGAHPSVEGHRLLG